MTSMIFLSGGVGKRMNSSLPKQYWTLGKKTVAEYSFDLFCQREEIKELIVVCRKDDQFRFQHPKVLFASPGERRQDSVYNGLKKTSSPFIAIHDAARPFITPDDLLRVLESGLEIGAAALAMPLHFTIKEVDESRHVLSTPDRSRYFEVQTPQALKRDILMKGFEYADKHGITVTDDVQLAELIGQPVKLVKGSRYNLKLTTKEDFICAEALLPHFYDQVPL